MPIAHVHEATVTSAVKVDFSLLEAFTEAVRVLTGDPVLEILFFFLCEGACCLYGDASVELAVSAFKIPISGTELFGDTVIAVEVLCNIAFVSGVILHQGLTDIVFVTSCKRGIFLITILIDITVAISAMNLNGQRTVVLGCN